MAACGKRRESGPSRENALTGAALSKRATAAATCASASFGRRAAREAKTRSAERCLPSRCSATPYSSVPSLSPLAGSLLERPQLCGRGERADAGGDVERGHEDRQVAGEARVQQVPGGDGVGGVGLQLGGRAPGGLRSVLSGPEERDAEVELDEGALRVEAGQLGEAGDGRVGPAREGLPDPRLERGVLLEERSSALEVVLLVQGEGAAQVGCLRVGAHAEVERERRRPGPLRRAGRSGDGGGTVAGGGGDADDEARRERGDHRDDRDDPGTRAESP